MTTQQDWAVRKMEQIHSVSILPSTGSKGEIFTISHIKERRIELHYVITKKGEISLLGVKNKIK